jgi:AcrR family transcriptional regulator
MPPRPAKKTTPAKRAGRPPDVRRALLDAALEIVKEQGVGAISLREAARRAGVTHGAPYRHFADRAALVAAVAEEGFRELLDAALAAASAAGGEPLKRFQALGVSYVKYAIEHPAHFRVMFGVEASGATPEVRAAESAVFALTVSALAEAQRAGLVIEGDTQELALCAWSTMHGLAGLLLGGMVDWSGFRGLDTDRLARRISLRLFDGMRPPAANVHGYQI